MSSIFASWSADRVLLAVDTAVHHTAAPAGLDANRAEACKMLALPSFGAAGGVIVAGRGSAAVLPLAALNLQMGPLMAGVPLTVDDALARFPDALDAAQAAALQEAQRAGHDDTLVREYEAVLAGFSERRQQMVVLVVWRTPADGRCTAVLDAAMPAWLTPSWADEPAPTTDAELLALAQRLVGKALADGGKGFGGRLICADLTPECVTLRQLGTLPT